MNSPAVPLTFLSKHQISSNTFKFLVLGVSDDIQSHLEHVKRKLLTCYFYFLPELRLCKMKSAQWINEVYMKSRAYLFGIMAIIAWHYGSNVFRGFIHLITTQVCITCISPRFSSALFKPERFSGVDVEGGTSTGKFGGRRCECSRTTTSLCVDFCERPTATAATAAAHGGCFCGSDSSCSTVIGDANPSSAFLNYRTGNREFGTCKCNTAGCEWNWSQCVATGTAYCIDARR